MSLNTEVQMREIYFQCDYYYTTIHLIFNKAYISELSKNYSFVTHRNNNKDMSGWDETDHPTFTQEIKINFWYLEIHTFSAFQYSITEDKILKYFLQVFFIYFTYHVLQI